jgi:acyl-CoA synthetase (AMP-forming)/AMP-acid ligase II/NAD(P)-dependent dehydrogenase (short-subunit alcohol dehydrogenase family)
MSESDPHTWPRQSLRTRVASWLLNPRGAPSLSRLRAAVGGKTVLITGASFGIGEATARLLASAGAKVLLAARSQEQLELVAAAIRSQGGTAEVHRIDLTNADAVADLARRLLDGHGSIDIVVNNAGKSIRRSVALSTDRFHDFERTIGVNYMGPVRLLLALLPEMRRRRSGQIVNVSTFGVRVPPGPRWGAYQASKAAFDTWFRSMGIEARSDGVVTSTIYMPLVYTRMSAPTPTLRGLPGLYPEQAAGLVARAIVRKSRIIAPWWLLLAELFGVLFRRPVEWVLGVFFRRSTDSPRAMGLKETPEVTDGAAGPPRTPSLRRAFRMAGLLPMWPRNLVRMARAVVVQGGRPSSLCTMTARRVPTQSAVIDEAGTVTYGELRGCAERLAAALQDRFGVGENCGVGVMCRNHRGFVETVLAASAAGADVVLINTEFPGPQLAQVLAHHRLACIVHDPEFVAAVSDSGYSGGRVTAGDTAEGVSVDALIESSRGKFTRARRGGKIVILTSGTTGTPKGAARSPKFRSQSGPLRTFLTRVPFRAGGTILIAPPLFHGMGFAYLNLSLFLGAAIVIRRRFDPEAVLDDIARHKVGVMIAVPSMLRRLLDVPESVRASHDFSSLRAVLTSGAALGGELGTRFMEAFGPCLYNLYGSSEVGFGAIATPEDLRAAPGTVGYAPAGTELRILGSDGQTLSPGQCGRVFVKTGLAFSGYVGGGTKEVIDGFMSTGDFGHLDVAGRLFVDGRADDMIISGGENVFPGEVEEALAGHPAVAEVTVFGAPDEQFGQRLRAFVVVRDGMDIGEEALRTYLKERVARFKLPRDFVFLPRLPRNALGKVLKRELISSGQH